jgi:hypothetical protein
VKHGDAGLEVVGDRSKGGQRCRQTSVRVCTMGKPEGNVAKRNFRTSLLQHDAPPAHTSPPLQSMGKTSRFRGVSFCRRTKRFKAVGFNLTTSAEVCSLALTPLCADHICRQEKRTRYFLRSYAVHCKRTNNPFPHLSTCAIWVGRRAMNASLTRQSGLLCPGDCGRSGVR